jgi:ribonucleotide reductase beta subunit family protein with ferritin-like domain
MEMISVQSKTNFFENRVSDYALSNKENDTSESFEFGDDF